MNDATPVDADERFDGEAIFMAHFNAAVSSLADQQRQAWAALELRFGMQLALQLAPILLPSLVSQAQEEAGALTLSEQQRWASLQAAKRDRALLLRLQEQQLEGNPW